MNQGSSSNGGYGAINMNTDEVKTLFSMGSKQIYGLSQQKFQELKKYADEGSWTWKILSFVGGLLIIFYAFFAFLAHVTTFSPFTAVIDLYLAVFGVASCLLEYKEISCTTKYLKFLKREALFLYRPYGRAFFYVFVGILILATGGLVGMLIGGYVTAIGVIIYYASRDAIKRLEDMKSSLVNENEIEKKFHQFDFDNSGKLDTKELAQLCQSLGTSLTLNELESAILILDRDSDGKISYDEFINWWRGKNDIEYV